jgi:hypothetical protein
VKRSLRNDFPLLGRNLSTFPVTMHAGRHRSRGAGGGCLEQRTLLYDDGDIRARAGQERSRARGARLLPLASSVPSSSIVPSCLFTLSCMPSGGSRLKKTWLGPGDTRAVTSTNILVHARLQVSVGVEW